MQRIAALEAAMLDAYAHYHDALGRAIWAEFTDVDLDAMQHALDAGHQRRPLTPEDRAMLARYRAAWARQPPAQRGAWNAAAYMRAHILARRRRRW